MMADARGVSAKVLARPDMISSVTVATPVEWLRRWQSVDGSALEPDDDASNRSRWAARDGSGSFMSGTGPGYMARVVTRTSVRPHRSGDPRIIRASGLLGRHSSR